VRSYRGLKSQDVKTSLQTFAFLKKRHFTAKFSKFCSESFYRLTDRRVVFKFREIWPIWVIGEIVRYLPDKKNRMVLQLSLLRGSRPKSVRASLRQCTQSAPDFIQIGSPSAEL